MGLRPGKLYGLCSLSGEHNFNVKSSFNLLYLKAWHLNKWRSKYICMDAMKE